MPSRLPVMEKDSPITFRDPDSLCIVKLARQATRPQPQGPQVNDNTLINTIEFDMQVCSDQGAKRSILRGSIKVNALLSPGLDLYASESIVTRRPIVRDPLNYGFNVDDLTSTLHAIITVVKDNAPEWFIPA